MAGTWANLLMAAALISLIPVAVVFVASNKRIAGGLRLANPDHS